MKVRSRAVVVAALCMSCVQVVQPKKVSMKLYKTDPTTWNKPYYYNLRSLEKSTTISRPPNPKLKMLKTSRTPEVTEHKDTIIRLPKAIKKDATISFDTDDENILMVCTQPGSNPQDNAACKKLTLPNAENYKSGTAIAIDNDYQPIIRGQDGIRAEIKNRQSDFFKIPVYKEDQDTWSEKWTITLVDEKKREYPDAKVVIYKDSTFKKLWIQKDVEEAKHGETYVQVRKPNGHVVETKLTSSPVDDSSRQLLMIDSQGNAAIKDKSVLENAPRNPKAKKPVESEQPGLELN